MDIIVASQLTKIYRQAVKEPGLKGALDHFIRPKYTNTAAVKGIDLTIKEGESVAFLGTNGAGKSTTIKMLTGILVPTDGTVLVHGYIPHKRNHDFLKHIAVVFGQRSQLWWDIPIIESFKVLKEIYEIDDEKYRSNLQLFNELLDLQSFMQLPVRKLSLGQRMRADLAAALLHDPKIIFLDEPTIGLDIHVKERIRLFIKQINKEKGVTILLTTHDLHDIEDVCQRLIIVDKGDKIYDGEVTGAKDTFARERTLNVKINEPRIENLKEMLLQPGIEFKESGDGGYLVKFDRFMYTAGEIMKLMIQGGDIIDFSVEEPSIEQVVKNIQNSNRYTEGWTV